MTHRPVLLHEVIKYLDPKAGDVIVDGTVNRAGHALALSQAVGPTGLIMGIDQDPEALDSAHHKLVTGPAPFLLIKGNFRQLNTILAKEKIETVDGILLDLGFSSEQLEAGKGFSFQTDEPLAMTFGDPKEALVTAYDVVNSWRETTLADIIYGFGEETFAKRIAKAIVKARKFKAIATTFDLVEVIRQAVPVWYTHKRLHFATKTFQAVRIAVNDELGALKEVIGSSLQVLATGGRLAIISFHSLEAKIVKAQFKNLVKAGAGELITKKAIKPARAETLANPRARSAQLKVIKKLI